MKRLAVVLLAGLLVFQLAACTDEQKEQRAIESAQKSSSLEKAEKFLQELKARMAEEVKPEYFESEE